MGDESCVEKDKASSLWFRRRFLASPAWWLHHSFGSYLDIARGHTSIAVRRAYDRDLRALNHIHD